MKVKLCLDCNIAGAYQYELIEVDDDTTDAELNAMAEQFMWENLQPDYWFEKDAEEEE